ncbi:uncharacterized protein [Leptinotarsa decemlineata]|uniref:uncharacterized protein n=1 Tax=Leptinotarsa decemlineata TaxID=7539 RepID=UPI003D308C3B
MSEVCRACLEPSTKTYPLVGNVLNVDVDIAVMLEYCISSELDLSENLPQSVCLTCFKRIRLAYHFLKQFQESQKKLFNLLQTREEGPPEKHKDEGIGAFNVEFLKCPENLEDLHNSVKVEDETEDQVDWEESFEVEKSEEVVFDENDQLAIELENLKRGDTGTLEFKYEDDTNIPTEVGSSNSYHRNIILIKNENFTEEESKKIQIVKDTFVSVTYKCPICSEEYDRYKVFYIHVLSHEMTRIVCSRCPNKVEFDLEDFFSHYKKVHKYQCYICNKRLSSSYGYQYHMKLHENIKKYKCPLKGCEKSFFLCSLLRKHVRTHACQSMYPCDLCHATFNSVGALKYHKKTHEGSRNHLCTHCGKAFYQSVHLRDHINRHMGHKTFTCDICGKSFVTNSQLKKHIKLCMNKKRLHEETLEDTHSLLSD